MLKNNLYGNFMKNAYTTKNIINIVRSRIFMTIMLMVCMFGGVFTPKYSYAGEGQWYGKQVCTIEKNADGDYVTPAQFKTDNDAIVSTIVSKIKERLVLVSQTMYQVVTLNPQYIMAIQAIIILWVVIYGVLFTTGMVQAKLSDFVMRMIKIGVIVNLTTPDAWMFFNDYLIKFFNTMTDSTINAIVQSANFSDPNINNIVSGLAPLSYLDSAVAKVVSPKMFVTLMAAGLTNEYGPFYFILMFLGIISFMKSIMTALWVYVMSLVIKTLLFGLAPIFIPTILFSRTKHIFDGWLSQLVNASLQPILLFTFFIFFVKLLEGSIDSMLHTPICFSKMPEGWRGSGFDFSFWRFMEYKEGDWKMKNGDWKLSEEFPIDLISVLTFFTIAELASRFNNVVIQISTQISKASTNLVGDGGPISTMYSSLTSKMAKGSQKP